MGKIRMLLIVFFLMLLIFSAGKVTSVLIDYHDGRESYASLEQYISFGELDNGTSEADGEGKVAILTGEMDSEAGIQLPQNFVSGEDSEEQNKKADVFEPNAAGTALPVAATIIPAAETAATVVENTISVDGTALPVAATIIPAAETAATVVENTISVDGTATPVVETTVPTTATTINYPEVDFYRLSSINPDVVGWIYVEGTHINYPIVQAADNEQYLNRMFDGKKNPAGCIFLDYRCASDFSDLHNILYGHHMRDDSMFADLVLYKEQNFYDEYPTAWLITPTHRYRVELFSSYVANDRDDAWQLNFGQQEFELWLKNRIERSSFKGDILPDGDESILTLSTCTYDYNGAKYVLHGFISETTEY